MGIVAAVGTAVVLTIATLLTWQRFDLPQVKAIAGYSLTFGAIGVLLGAVYGEKAATGGDGLGLVAVKAVGAGLVVGGIGWLALWGASKLGSQQPQPQPQQQQPTVYTRPGETPGQQVLRWAAELQRWEAEHQQPIYCIRFCETPDQQWVAQAEDQQPILSIQFGELPDKRVLRWAEKLQELAAEHQQPHSPPPPLPQPPSSHPPLPQPQRGNGDLSLLTSAQLAAMNELNQQSHPQPYSRFGETPEQTARRLAKEEAERQHP